MENYTYEAAEQLQKYETYEWDSTWIDHAKTASDNRVLYIGDSISCGIRRPATAQTGNSCYFDGLGTSKAVDNPYFYDTIKLFARQQGTRKAILFNNGLHGWHLGDETEYKYYYEEMVKFLLQEFEGTPLFLVLTTHITDSDREDRVLRRNHAAQEIAEKYDLKVIDLYSVSLEAAALLDSGGVHWLPEGYETLAAEIVRVLSRECGI